MESNSPIFERLAGIETEYAIRFPMQDPDAWRPPNSKLFERILAGVRARVPVVDTQLHLKQGAFTANGGALWFEATVPGVQSGLVEGSTPECRGPRQLVVYQRCQDQLLAEVCQSLDPADRPALLKNDRDSQGHAYGTQENYEVEIARGLRLVLWRIGLLLLFPLAVIGWVGTVLILAGGVLYYGLAGLAYLFACTYLPPARRERAFAALMGTSSGVGPEHTLDIPPIWLSLSCLWIARVVLAPLALGITLLVWLTAFHRLRREFVPFLVSRVILAGSGLLEEDGRYWLGAKARGTNCLLGIGEFLKDRPLFGCGQYLKALWLRFWFSPRDCRWMFARRQRIQVWAGDSNMSEEAEYLRIGTTMLVLDAIEAGAFRSSPRFRRPIAALRAFCLDPTLQATVRDAQKRTWTALELQRYYYETCRQFIEEHPDPPPEARDVLRRWAEVLTCFETGDRMPLLGRIDWVTKKYLIEKAAATADWETQKKIDLRYHELSPDGYFSRLDETEFAARVLSAEEIAHALRNPPPHTRAATRGRYIREFHDGGVPLKVDWNKVIIGPLFQRQVVRLEPYDRGNGDHQIHS